MQYHEQCSHKIVTEDCIPWITYLLDLIQYIYELEDDSRNPDGLLHVKDIRTILRKKFGLSGFYLVFANPTPTLVGRVVTRAIKGTALETLRPSYTLIGLVGRFANKRKGIIVFRGTQDRVSSSEWAYNLNALLSRDIGKLRRNASMDDNQPLDVGDFPLPKDLTVHNGFYNLFTKYNGITLKTESGKKRYQCICSNFCSNNRCHMIPKIDTSNIGSECKMEVFQKIRKGKKDNCDSSRTYEINASIQSQVNEAIHKISKDAPDKFSWVITGHSLGGALAILTAFQMSLKYGPAMIAGVYTFGAPKVGMTNFATLYNTMLKTKTFRIENLHDEVPTHPQPYCDLQTGCQDYQPVGTLILLHKEFTTLQIAQHQPHLLPGYQASFLQQITRPTPSSPKEIHPSPREKGGVLRGIRRVVVPPLIATGKAGGHVIKTLGTIGTAIGTGITNTAIATTTALENAMIVTSHKKSIRKTRSRSRAGNQSAIK